ncbi:LacI family DNA-binding transcriptional regulator [Humidisolicoccus flavus]|uniref:LacI family DNA-binding transcriptional regulator n=1 Tax=Humidisolicoccus flavus TaxID=3111414 RepID=UPI003249DDAB
MNERERVLGIDDVAQAAGVSTASVSRALSGKTNVSAAMRDKVLSIANELGYAVSASASGLASGKMHSIGVITPSLGRWYFSTVLSGVAEELARRGYSLTLYSVPNDIEDRGALFASLARRRAVDALVVVAVEIDHELDTLQRFGIPIILVGGALGALPSLRGDGEGMARLATQHLIGLGHTRIAHIGGAPEFDADFHVPAERLRGYRNALEHAGIVSDPSLTQPANFTVRGGRAAALQLLGLEHPPTAIFAASDEMAIGAILAAQQLRFRLPEEVSIVGVDGHPLGEVYGLTTVDQNVKMQGVWAAQHVVDQVEGAAAAPAREELPFSLVVRDSTARHTTHAN